MYPGGCKRVDEEIEGRWEAARTLHVWFCHLLEAKGASAVLARAARAVTDLYVASGEEVRNAIEQGFLEHVLETVALRQYFENWASDPRLRVAWERALKWVRPIQITRGDSFDNFEINSVGKARNQLIA